MNTNYRVNWQAGMRLTEKTFRAADEFHVKQLHPLYALMASGGYGFLELPIIRYEFSESAISFIEIQADAVSSSGKLINLHYTREERNMFQNMLLPEKESAVIAFVDASSSKTVKVADSDQGVPLCDSDYQIILKREDEHYNNPDAVPFARFIYRHGWEQDSYFIAPCLLLRANGNLLRSASLYTSTLKDFIQKLKDGVRTTQSEMVMALLPVLSAIAVETEKEAETMSPLRFVSLMQQAIQVIVTMAEMYEGLVIPEHSACKEYADSYFSPCSVARIVDEGIRLTKALIDLPASFTEVEHVEKVGQPVIVSHRPHGDETRGRINRQGNGFRR